MKKKSPPWTSRTVLLLAVATGTTGYAIKLSLAVYNEYVHTAHIHIASERASDKLVCVTETYSSIFIKIPNGDFSSRSAPRVSASHY